MFTMVVKKFLSAHPETMFCQKRKKRGQVLTSFFIFFATKAANAIGGIDKIHLQTTKRKM